jgi:nucleotidyltransferase/DNA polymerase involved in DNA repair
MSFSTFLCSGTKLSVAHYDQLYVLKQSHGNEIDIVTTQVQRKHVYTLRQALLLDDPYSCRQRLLKYMQAVADEMILQNVDSSKHPRKWKISSILNEFHELADRTFSVDVPNVQTPSDVLSHVTADMVVAALVEFEKANLDAFVLPGLPKPPGGGPKGLRSKVSAMKRWLEMTSDGSVP